jgi:dipeptidyl aminopeptidase/acylaminoacyl peptidase
MRVLLLAALPLAALAQRAPFTLDQVLGAPFPSALTASSSGALAWVSNLRGVRNILVAEPPKYEPRKITPYTADDGQDLGELQWAPGAAAIVFVRGGSGTPPNPALDIRGAEQAVWIVRLDGTPPRRIGSGNSPSISPDGTRVAYVLGGRIWMGALDGSTPPAQAFQARGTCGRPVWSPDGARIAFANARGDHGFIGVYDIADASLRYLDPGTGIDGNPEWSPDGRSVAFTRFPSSGLRAVRQARREGEPWSIRIANAVTGDGREIWRANEGPGSVFRGVTAISQLLWMDGDRVIFPWEGDGWTHLYSVTASGGKASLLTPGEFEVEDVNPAPGRKEVIFSSNQGDIDRRHIWRVAAAGGAPSALTQGTGIESQPVAAGDAIAFFQSNGQIPLHTAIRIGTNVRSIEQPPADFPVTGMVVPQQVIFPAADGLSLHGQLFLPPNRTGRSPAIVFFHGGPLRQMLLGWHYHPYYFNAYAMNQYLAASGYVVLSVNFRSGVGYGMHFREALHFGASGGSDYNDVQGAGVYLRSRPDVDPARIGAWGGSYGGYLTAMALARASELYKAGVDLHGVHNWATELGIPPTEPDYRIAFEASPMHYVRDWRGPVLLIHGDDDRNVQFNQTVVLASALRRQKVDVEELIFPDEVHDFLLYRSWRAAYEAAARFFDRKLGQ